MSRKWNTEKFIQKAKEIYSDKYTYEKTKYEKYHKSLIITCPKHGDFKVQPAYFLNNHACKKCGYEKNVQKASNTIDYFIKRAKEIHGDKYYYSLIEYVNNHTKVKIICKKCGRVF